jgi:hypothetical protein
MRTHPILRFVYNVGSVAAPDWVRAATDPRWCARLNPNSLSGRRVNRNATLGILGCAALLSLSSCTGSKQRDFVGGAGQSGEAGQGGEPAQTPENGGSEPAGKSADAGQGGEPVQTPENGGSEPTGTSTEAGQGGASDGGDQGKQEGGRATGGHSTTADGGRDASDAGGPAAGGGESTGGSGQGGAATGGSARGEAGSSGVGTTVPAGGQGGTAPEGGSGPGLCLCSERSACCDGCLPVNDGGTCESDDLTCTTDTCNSGACEHRIQSNSCLIGGQCLSHNQANPANACQYCDTTKSGVVWQRRAESTTCDDGFFCNGDDVCNASGQCTHTGDPCDGAQTCAEANGGECCTPNAEIRCSADGDVAQHDSCGNSGDVVVHCAPTNSRCLDAGSSGVTVPTCTCQPGFTGPGCQRCLLYVDGTLGDDGDTGESWDAAFRTLKNALLVASGEGCEIWVTAGTYQVDGNQGTSFYIADGVDVYGGFAGGEVLRSQRDWKQNVTILSGLLKDQVWHAYHTVSVDSGARVVLDGLTIQDGEAIIDDGAETAQDHGGGIYTRGFPLIRNSIITANTSRYDGAGVYAQGGSPLLVDTRLVDNSTSNTGDGWSGGGMACQDSEPIVVNSLVAGNFSYAHGCGLSNMGASWLTLIQSTVISNSCGGDQQIFAEDTSHMTSYNSISWWNGYQNTGTAKGSDYVFGSDIGRYGASPSYSNIDEDPLLDTLHHINDPASLCIDGGRLEVGTYSDLDGNGRSGNPDMGAYEYQGVPSDADPLCGTPRTWAANGHQYLFCVPVTLSWYAADLYCRSAGGHLANVADAQENNFVASGLPDYERAWIGASDYKSEGAWTWALNESTLTYTNWATDEPSADAAADCARISRTDGKWAALDCQATRLPFVCEIE